MHVSMYVSMYVCMYVRTYICMFLYNTRLVTVQRTDTYTHIHIYTHTYMCANDDIIWQAYYTCIYIYIYIHRTHTHTHVNIYKHTAHLLIFSSSKTFSCNTRLVKVSVRGNCCAKHSESDNFIPKMLLSYFIPTFLDPYVIDRLYRFGRFSNRKLMSACDPNCRILSLYI